MNRAEVAQLLTMCAAYDRRTVGDADVMAWAAPAVLGSDEISFADAQQAVQEHYGRTDAFVMPSHIKDGVKRIRRDRLDKADATFVYRGDPDDVDEYKRQLAMHRRGIGDGAEPVLPVLPVLDRAAPPKAAIANVFPSVPRMDRTVIEGEVVKPEPKRGGPSEASLELARAEWARVTAEARQVRP